MPASTIYENDRMARKALRDSEAAIISLLGPKTGIAFAGSARVTEAARFQFARYGDVKICLVNPKGGQAEEFTVFKTIRDVPDDIDLAVIRTAPKHVPALLEDCGARGIGQAIVFTDGFGETGSEGAALERQLAEIVESTGVRILGPNTNDNAFEVYPDPENHRGRRIGLITQSGAIGRAIVEGADMGAAFERWITTGNEVDLEAADFIHYFAGLPQIGAIALYIEGFKDSAKLRVALERALVEGKPVVAIKMGSTESGAKAAASHTGHLTGADAVVEGLFDQYGVTRVDDLDELLETANLFSKLPEDSGVRCCAYTMSGGASALVAETAAKAGIDLPTLRQEVQDKLHTFIQSNLNVSNPIDNGGVFIMQSDPQVRQEVMDIVAREEEIDIFLICFNAAYGPVFDRMAADALTWAPASDKPAVAVWSSTNIGTQGYRDLIASGVPVFRSFKKCMKALADFKRFGERRRQFVPLQLSPRKLEDRQAAALSQAGVLDAKATSALLRGAGIEFAQEAMAGSSREAGDIAERMGFPVVLKLMSSAFPHKTDLGLVRLDVRSRADAEAIADELIAKARSLDPAAVIDGVLVQEQIGKGVEMIVGLSHDPQFGPTLTIGAGGIHAEVLRDVVARPLPVSEQDIRDMIAALRSAPLLDGVRGAKPADREALVQMALKVGQLGEAANDRLAELDLNPVVVLEDRAVAVDALAVAAAGQPDEAPQADAVPVS